MAIELFFNELSSVPAADNIAEARSRVAEFAGTLSAAVKAGCNPVLRTSEEFGNSLLAPNYYFHNWRNDPLVGRDHRVFINSLAVKAPHLLDTSADQLQTFENCEGMCGNVRATGLTAASICEGLAISFLNGSTWDLNQINLRLTSLDGEGELVSSSASVRHACRAAHIQGHSNWILETRSDVIQDGTTLWSNKSEIFSSLDFCEELKSTLGTVGKNHACFHVLMQRLHGIQKCAGAWQDGAFPFDQLSGGPRQESSATLEKYGDCRTFLCPDGISRLFSWHLSLPLGWRLYFFPDETHFRVHIGYIGKHLPTKKFPK